MVTSVEVPELAAIGWQSHRRCDRALDRQYVLSRVTSRRMGKIESGQLCTVEPADPGTLERDPSEDRACGGFRPCDDRACDSRSGG
jgi:hypothetical protein